MVKITCKGGAGVGAEVLRVIESLGFEITYTALEHIKPLHVLTTVFIRVCFTIFTSFFFFFSLANGGNREGGPWG